MLAGVGTPGSVVRLTRLMSRKDLNGKSASVIGVCETGRIAIHTEDGEATVSSLTT